MFGQVWAFQTPSYHQDSLNPCRGICQSCGEQLLCNDLSADEYTHLLHHFEDQVKFKAGTENVSRWSIVRGLRKIAKERIGGPFGAVLDGLNIAQRQCFTRSNPVSPPYTSHPEMNLPAILSNTV